MNIDQLPYIIAIANAGNLTAAAEQTGVSQQALSKYLLSLETETGLELFFRSKRRYLPTPAGRLYLQTAQQILDLRQHTYDALTAPEDKQQKPLRLGVSPNRGIEAMEYVYPPFERRYPRTELTVTEGYARELMDGLLERKLDAVITGHLGELPAGLQTIPIHSEELVLAVPAFHPLVRHRTARLEELPFTELKNFQDSLFIQPRPSSNMHAMVQQLFDTEHFQPRVTVALPNTRLQLAMIRSGTHVALLPSYYVRPDPDIAFFRLHNSPRMTMVYMTRSGHRLAEAERYLVWLLLSMMLRQTDIGILWSDALKEISLEFGPADVGGMA